MTNGKIFVKPGVNSLIVIGSASALSAVIISIALIFVGKLFNDINSLYVEVINEMEDFKVKIIIKSLYF